MDQDILIKIIGVLIIFLITILCYFLKEFLREMKSLNEKLVKVVTNQEWHFKSILELQAGEEKMSDRITSLERIRINANKHEVVE